MKRILQIIVFCLCLNATVFGQYNPKGVWIVCDSTEICEDASLPLYMIISDSTMHFVFSLSTGLDPKAHGPTYYSIENDIMETIDTNSTGEVFINHFDVIWKSNDEFHLIDHKGDVNMYLFRKEE